jgi:hypothetical protein
MDDKLKSTLDKIITLTQQNTEFDTELRKRLKVASANSPFLGEEYISQIYEYCIEKIIHQQAEEFYKDFPLTALKTTLIEDFCRMESFHRKDNFGDFCLALYQQIECMTNKICENSDLSDITSKMWGCHAYVKEEKGKPIDISNRVEGVYSIAQLVFFGNKYIEKSQSTLQAQNANDKMRILVYFLGYKGMMRAVDYDYYKEFTTLLSEIYLCRNMNHRGNSQNDREKAVLDKIYPLKSFYYFKFLGVLAQYVDYIKTGLGSISDLKKYSDTIIKQVIPGPKVVGMIELKDDGKKRIK